METRTILQIVLGLMVAAVVGIGGLLGYQLTREAETIVVKKVVDSAEEKEEIVNPWSLKGEAAISLVKRVKVQPPLNPDTGEKKKRRKADDEEEAVTLGELMEREEWVRKKLNVTGEPQGWKATWWGETKYGPSFFLVRYAFQDHSITVGPEWIVDLKKQKVVAKNLPARVAENPAEGMKSDYYDKKQMIVSAIGSHRFDSGMSLGGALLLYFEQRVDEGRREDDNILGWTIHHDEGSLFKAYFQWEEEKEPTYAEFEFDFDRKALKAVNLQAANIMRVGEEFERERVSIMPSMYDPKATRSALKWKGPARKQCRKPRMKDRCNALATILDEHAVIESLEWLLTARANEPADFEECKEERNCKWIPEFQGEDKYNVKYSYKLGETEKSVSWDVLLKKSEIIPTDRVSKLAFAVIRPR